LFLLLVLGCAPKPTPPSIAPERHDPCRLVADSSTRLDTVTVALLEPVNLVHATAPANDSERLLFRHLFDNLIRLDCEAAIRPGLVESWTRDSSRRGWVLTLRQGATFPIGMPMSAAAAARALRELPPTDTVGREAFRIDSAVDVDERRLRVVFRDSGADTPPRALADPALVLVDALASVGGNREGSLTIPPRGKLPVLEFWFPQQRDVRDALDREVDLVVTRDPALVDYVSNRVELVTFPLPWSRTYVLAYTEGFPGQLITDLNQEAFRSSLAEDAVRASARAAEPPYWWSDLEACGAPAARQPVSAAPHITYRRDDEVARGLAERVVALAPASTGLRAVGLEAAQFDQAVRNGTERAYVIGLPRQSLAPCRDASMLPPGTRPLPLIETRAYAIVRKGVPPLSVEWDGTPRLVGP